MSAEAANTGSAVNTASVVMGSTRAGRSAHGPAPVGGLTTEARARCLDLLALYPHPRSALLPICHVAQEEHGWLTPGIVAEVAALVGITPAEVTGTASFYDMLHTEPVGKYLVAICTNIACMLKGAYELLEHAEEHLGVRAGGTTADGLFTLEDAECLADCGRAPCLAVNHRFFGDVTDESFDQMIDDLAGGRHDADVPPHGTLIRVRRAAGLAVEQATVEAERAAAAADLAARAAAADASQAVH